MAKKLPDDCMPSCKGCAFVELEPGADAGYCRRFPPQTINTGEDEYSAFPVIDATDWCGEFKRRVS